MFIEGSSLDEKYSSKSGFYRVPGTLQNLNKIEEFRDLDKKKVINDIAQFIFDSMKSGKFLEAPEELFRFHVISFSDLKKYTFLYWFAFPSILPKDFKIHCTKTLELTWDKKTNDSWTEFQKENEELMCFCVDKDMKFRKLSELKGQQLSFDKVHAFCYIDCGARVDNPSWHLRNYVLALCSYFKIEKITIWCLRELNNNFERSTELHLTTTNASKLPEKLSDCRVLGWEKNQEGT
eukprot:UN32349